MIEAKRFDGNLAIFKKRRNSFLLYFVIIAVVTAGASLITEFDWGASITSFPKAFGWLIQNSVPSAASVKQLPSILFKLWQTVLISIMSTVIAAILAFGLALLGARPTRPNLVFSGIVRGVASFFRNIPVAAWAMIFLFSFGQSMFTGFLAIFVESFGFLVRSFIEVIDESSDSSVEGLRATGANYPQIIVQAVIPSVKPLILSWMLFQVESNIRSATLVGILTGSGIGFAFDLFYKNVVPGTLAYNYPAAAMVVITIVVVVLLIETVSNQIRRVIL